MKHLELHIIQSVPVACLNRDDLNSPKTAVFGGFQRARVSSQCWKRAIREMIIGPDFDVHEQFKGQRSRLFIKKINAALAKKKEDETTINALSLCAGHYLGKLDPKQEGKVKTLVFLSPLEYEKFAELLHTMKDADKKKLVDAISRLDRGKLEEDDDSGDEATTSSNKRGEGIKGEKKLTAKQFNKIVAGVLKKRVEKAFKNVSLPKDTADISLFGRMVANDHSLAVEAAAMFSHALSTHKANNEIDFFAAVDDLQDKNEPGAAITSTLEFNSATYYRFAAVNLDMLADDGHLGALEPEERRTVVRTFIEATIKAIPGARKNTMNANTLPVYVLGVVRDKGHPLQLVNAFENPVRPRQGYADQSVKLLKEEYAKLKGTWGVEAVLETAIPDVNLTTFLDEVVKHVD